MIECAVILAVGNPLHRSQLTYNRVQAMLPALGKPLIVRIMNRLHRVGIRHYIVVVGVNEGPVAAYLNHNWVPNAKIELVLKSQNDSLIKILSGIARKHEKPFLVASYNSFTHVHFPESLIKNHVDAEHALVLSGAASSLSRSQQHYFAEVADGKVRGISSEKPDAAGALTLADIAICGHDCVRYLAQLQGTTSTFHYHLMDIFAQYVQSSGETQIAETAWILQVDADYDLLTLNRLLLDEGRDAHILSELPGTVHVVPPIRVDPQVSVGQGATIGPYAYLERGSYVGQDATVQNAIILESAKVSAGQLISDAIVTSRGGVIR